MRIILGLFLALLMVLAALFAFIDMTCEQARAPDDREIAIEMRDCGITTPAMLLFRPLAIVALEDSALAASNDNNVPYKNAQEDAATPADAWCPEVAVTLKFPTGATITNDFPGLAVLINTAENALPGRKRGRTGA